MAANEFLDIRGWYQCHPDCKHIVAFPIISGSSPSCVVPHFLVHVWDVSMMTPCANFKFPPSLGLRMSATAKANSNKINHSVSKDNPSVRLHSHLDFFNLLNVFYHHLNVRLEHTVVIDPSSSHGDRTS